MDCGKGELEKIGRLDEKSRAWSIAGHLKSPRAKHGVIYDGETFLVVGGNAADRLTDAKTENCILEGELMTCTEHESAPLVNYKQYPVLFLTNETNIC